MTFENLTRFVFGDNCWLYAWNTIRFRETHEKSKFSEAEKMQDLNLICWLHKRAQVSNLGLHAVFGYLLIEIIEDNVFAVWVCKFNSKARIII